MFFRQSWRMDRCEYMDIVREIIDECATLPRCYPRLGVSDSLAVFVENVHSNAMSVYCDPPVLCKSEYSCDVAPNVELVRDNDMHLHIVVTFGPGACIASVCQHVGVLMSKVTVSTTISQHGAEDMVVYAIELDGYPPVCFTSQQPVTTDIGRLQKRLGADTRFVVWSVGLTANGIAISNNDHLHTRKGLACGINYGIDGMAAAKMMMLYTNTDHSVARIDVKKFVSFKED